MPCALWGVATGRAGAELQSSHDCRGVTYIATIYVRSSGDADAGGLRTPEQSNRAVLALGDEGKEKEANGMSHRPAELLSLFLLQLDRDRTAPYGV